MLLLPFFLYLQSTWSGILSKDKNIPQRSFNREPVARRYPEKSIERIEHHMRWVSVIPPGVKCLGNEVGHYGEQSPGPCHRYESGKLRIWVIEVLSYLTARDKIISTRREKFLLSEEMRVEGSTRDGALLEQRSQ